MLDSKGTYGHFVAAAMLSPWPLGARRDLRKCWFRRVLLLTIIEAIISGDTMIDNIISFPDAKGAAAQEIKKIPESGLQRQFWRATFRHYEDPDEMARGARQAFRLGYMSYELMQWFATKAEERKNRN